MKIDTRIKILENRQNRLETKDAIQDLRQHIARINEELRAIQDYLNINIVHQTTVAKDKPL